MLIDPDVQGVNSRAQADAGGSGAHIIHCLRTPKTEHECMGLRTHVLAKAGRVCATLILWTGVRSSCLVPLYKLVCEVHNGAACWLQSFCIAEHLGTVTLAME